MSDGRRLMGARLVGRQREMARIRACVDAVRGGGTAVLELVGDPGIGKSRLLGEAEQVAGQAGLEVVTGSASQFERELPFAVFGRLFDLLGGPTGAAAGTPGQPAGPVGPGTPAGPTNPSTPGSPVGLADAGNPSGPGSPVSLAVAGTAGDPAATHPGVERFRFYRAVRDRLAARPRGLALLVDDLHWADPASLELLEYLLRHPPATPLLLAVAYRPRQVSPRAAGVFTVGGSELLRERLDLAPLGVTEIATLTGSGAAEARRLHAASGGNPFYALALAGSPYPAEPIHPAATDRIPPAVAAAVRAELGAVPEPELAVLHAAAVAGDPFDPALVAALVERPFDAVLAALDLLADRDLVRSEPSEPGRFRLRHPLLRSIVYHEIRPGQRLALHARAASALLDRGAHVVTRAPHLARSAQPGDVEAAQALVGAARQILPTAPDTAGRWLRDALQLLPEGADADLGIENRGRLMLLLADAEVSSGRVDTGRAVLQHLLDRLPPGVSELRLEAVMRSAFADRLLGRYRQATALLDGVLASAGDDEATVLLAAEAVSCSLQRCSTDSHRYAERARSAAAAASKPELAAVASMIVALNGAFHGEIADAQAQLDAAAAVLDGANDEALFRVMDPLKQLGWVELLLERSADALGHFDRGLDISRRHGQVHLTPYLLIGRCLALTRRGQVGAALESAADAEEAARLIGSDTMHAMALAIRALATLWRDGPDAALRVAEEAVRRNDRPRHDWWAAVARRVLARCQLGVGNLAAARHALLGTGTDLNLAEVEACAHPMWLATLAEIDGAAGQPEAAARWLARAEAAAERTGLRGQHAFVSVAAARLALDAGDPARAADLATAAVAGFDHIGQPLDAAVARLTAAGALARTGRWPEATDHLTAAKAMAERGGATWFLQRVIGLQRQIASGAGRAGVAEAPAAPTAPDGLTAREWEIARLVGDGLSNAQIALRLHVTPKTVEAHLTRIYRKVGVRSRSGLAKAVADLRP